MAFTEKLRTLLETEYMANRESRWAIGSLAFWSTAQGKTALSNAMMLSLTHGYWNPSNPTAIVAACDSSLSGATPNFATLPGYEALDSSSIGKFLDTAFTLNQKLSSNPGALQTTILHMADKAAENTGEKIQNLCPQITTYRTTIAREQAAHAEALASRAG